MTARRPALAALLALAMLGTTVGMATPSSASGGVSIACLPVSGLASGTETQARALMSGQLTIPGYKTVNIGTTGNVNWGIDPFGDSSWRRLFLSMKWVEMLTIWYQRHPDRDADMLARAEAIAADFAHDNPAGGGPRPADAWVGMYAGQRATTYSCLNDITPNLAWVRAALSAHGTWLNDPKHDPGAWNQGVDTYIGLMAAGCVVGSSTWADHASTRLDQLVGQTIGADGAVLEQAPGYGSYLYDRWGIAASVIQQCGRAVPAALSARRTALMEFLAWSTEPSSMVGQLGDTFRAALPTSSVGASAQWAASGGTTGAHPSATNATFTSGWAFGRSTWDPYASSAWYALRWGPGRAYHGHDDHQSVLLDALGHQILVDAGHGGYTVGAYRDFLVSPAAHNVLTLPGVAFDKRVATTLTRSGGAGSWRWFELSDTAYGGRARTRGVLVDTAFPLVLTFDRASRATSGVFQQLWHLPPGSRVTVSGRNVARALSADGRVRTSIVQFALPGQTIPAGSTGVVSGRTSPYQGWVSYANGSRTAAPTVVMGRSGTSVGIITVVVPTSSSVTPAFGFSKGTDGWYRVTVVAGSTTRVLRISPSGLLAG